MTVFRRVAVGVVAAGVLAVGAGGSAAADAVSVPDRCLVRCDVGVVVGITPSVGVSVSASGPGVNAGLSGTVGPIFSTTIKPGQIV
ncbi:hypothetical protein NOF53_26730, partial [Rhodococcus sp. FXJ9.536]|nr:hypothetical protein [Rhodococcus sp. FXJ9.536]